jgi:acetyltransferase-like isoleucine patch superfamily enzyme
MRDLVHRIQSSVARDREMPLSHLVLKGLRYGASIAAAPLYLLGCDKVGAGARARGRPLIDNAGYIEIGARAILNSLFSPIELAAGPEGRIVIGDDAWLNTGVVIRAEREVKLGDRVGLGPYVCVSDSDVDDVADGEPGPRPIVIGDDAWLAARVRVRGGAIIGQNAVIAAGADVVGEIPPNVIAGGAPARVLRVLSSGERARDVGPRAGDVGPRAGDASESAAPVSSGVTHREAPSGDGAGAGALRPMLRRAGAAAGSALARFLLAGASRVGARPRVHGRPFIESLGKILIGDDLRLLSSPVRTHLVTGKDGVLQIGDGVTIGPGAGISSDVRIEIGDGARLGPYVLVMDSDFHDPKARRSSKGARDPIVIEEHARIDERAIVLRGARVGRYAHIAAGSVVPPNMVIPAFAFAAGVPARVIPRSRPEEEASRGR